LSLNLISFSLNHMSQNKATAILFFSRTASEEAAIKTFHPNIGRKGNIAISQCLIDQTKTVSQRTNLAFFSSFSPQQTGNQFGERLANAIEFVYNKGYEKVIVIGNDCPSISTDLLLNVDKLLENNPLVLGPATDGGVYLIGIDRSIYSRDFFLALPWQKSSLQNGWINYAQQITSSIEWLECYSDIDVALDFLKLLKELPSNSCLLQQLQSILNPHQSIPVFDELESYKNNQSTPFFLRGPPSSIPYLRS